MQYRKVILYQLQITALKITGFLHMNWSEKNKKNYDTLLKIVNQHFK